MSNIIKPWRILSSKVLNYYRIFETRTDRVLSPRTNEEMDVYIVAGSSWVNILAITEDQKIVIVQQYRHGTRQVMWEIPGGVIDEGETPEEAATRELLEETGYAGKEAKIIGKVHPNPAYQTNICYTILIENAQKVQEPKLDSTEDIAVELVSEEKFEQMIISGEISHSLVVVADLWRRFWKSGKLPSAMV
jgi:ADP-ribose pyrophosphatase